MKPALTLTNISFDLHIMICMFLHPSDILALRKTCKTLEYATRRRIVWVAALHRVCFVNTLFLPSFPIRDMSNLELEQAAMAPRRWIELCGAFQKRQLESNDISEILHTRTTRMIKVDGSYYFYIVPGGRFLVAAGDSVSVWDLGHVPTVGDCKLLASADMKYQCQIFMVQATPDGKGLCILSTYDTHLSIFEIFPQSEKPLLTQIADLECVSSEENPGHLLPNTLIFRTCYVYWMVFRVLDYRTNYSTCFAAKFFSTVTDTDDVETFATKTTIIIFCKEGILIYAIPPLLPQSSDFQARDYFIDNKFKHVPPLFRIPYPDGSTARSPQEKFLWMTPSSWYFAHESVYFDILYNTDSKLQRFKIIIKPDHSDASLHIMNKSEIIPDLLESLEAHGAFEECRFCEDALVYFWNNHETWGAYAGLISDPFPSIIARWTRVPGHRTLGSLCPTSGRFLYRSVTSSELLAVAYIF